MFIEILNYKNMWLGVRAVHDSLNWELQFLLGRSVTLLVNSVNPAGLG